MSPDTPTAPERRLRFKLDLQADDIIELAATLGAIAYDVESTMRETRDVTSGGYASGYHYTLDCRPEQDGDQYREQLREWMAARRAARHAAREAVSGE